MKCKKCGTENVEGETSCKNCGYVFKNEIENNDDLLKEVICECGQKLNYKDTKCSKCGKDIPSEKLNILKSKQDEENTKIVKYQIIFFVFFILSLILVFNPKKTYFSFGLISLVIPIITSTIGKIKHPDDETINVLFTISIIILSVIFGIILLIASCMDTISSCPG